MYHWVVRCGNGDTFPSLPLPILSEPLPAVIIKGETIVGTIVDNTSLVWTFYELWSFYTVINKPFPCEKPTNLCLSLPNTQHTNYTYTLIYKNYFTYILLGVFDKFESRAAVTFVANDTVYCSSKVNWHIHIASPFKMCRYSVRICSVCLLYVIWKGKQWLWL